MHPFPGSHMPENAGELYDSLGNLRLALEKGKDKISWTFVNAVKAADGCIRQFYVKRADDDGNPGHGEGRDQVDSVIELDWCSG